MSEDASQVSGQAAWFYEDFLLPALFAQWAGVMVDAGQVGPGDRVLDVACGTGVLARAAGERVGPDGTVVGLDRNDGMLSVARALAPQHEWHEGLAEELPFPVVTFDVVVSQFGLMFFADRVRALAEMWRVLRPGGRLAVAVWAGLDEVPGYAAFIDVLRRSIGSEAAEAMRAPFALGDAVELGRLVVDAGIDDFQVRTHPGVARFPSLDSWITADAKGWILERYVDDAGLARLLEEAALKAFVTADGGVEFPMPAHIVSAGKTA